MSEITLKNVKITYTIKKENYVAVENGNAIFPAHSFNVIVGASGCGKTSLLKAILGLIPYEGEIFFNEQDAITLSMEEKNIAYVSQNYALYPHLTIFDNIAFPLRLLHCPKQEIIERVNELATKLDIVPCLSRKPKQISGGQQQRAAIARALIKKPSVCLFDEPLSNLDEKAKLDMLYLFKKAIVTSNTSVLYVTHNLKEAMALADMIFVMDHKQIETTLTPKEVFDSTNKTIQYMVKAGALAYDNNR